MIIPEVYASKLQYITATLSSYNTYLASLNKLGLYDASVMFEMFAQEVASAFYNKPFKNLNIAKSNYPFVDLISEDGTIFVQVSTEQNVPAKIKRTLENIDKARNDKGKKAEIASGIKEVTFFVPGNESVGRVRDYTGKNRIGSIEFKKDDNLITFEDLEQKADTDSAFLEALYKILHDDSEEYRRVISDLRARVETSRALIDQNIVDTIGDDTVGIYEIDRSELIKAVKSEQNRFISIQGNAGSGKSAFCKKLLKDERAILYARAEKFLDAVNLRDVWDLDLGTAFRYLGSNRLVIYIDALEFIADAASRTKMDMLIELYDLVSRQGNIHLITSCRTTDKGAFIQLEGIYGIKVYDIPAITDNEFAALEQKYDIVSRLSKDDNYRLILRNPFYVNLLVTHASSDSDFTNISTFRDYIWEHVICLGDCYKEYGITFNSVRDAVNTIVFDRAKHLSVGISKERIDHDILHALDSEGIISFNGNKIRLKYDIFEDICFEKRIDQSFEDADGSLAVFFDDIEKLGKCVYRRYQIWVENKLADKGNRKHFLYRVLSSETAPHKWIEQSAIGIVRSRDSGDFFTEFRDRILGSQLGYFLHIVNKYAYNPRILELKYGNVYTVLDPVGSGRNALIRIIHDSSVYLSRQDLKSDIAKLCSDMSANTDIEDTTARDICDIFEYFVDETLSDSDELIRDDDKIVNGYLDVIYRFAEISHDWIRLFWEKETGIYSHSFRGRESRIAEKIIVHVLKHARNELCKYLPDEMCRLADSYWIENGNPAKLFYEHEKAEEYGLSSNAEYYNNEFRNPASNQFINKLVVNNYLKALTWVIQLTNSAASVYKKNNPDEVIDIILVDDKGEEHKYIGNAQFWMAGVQDYTVPDLIGDAIYTLTNYAVFCVKGMFESRRDSVEKFVNNIRDIVIARSNNIMMLSMLESIGFQCFYELPGYALALCTDVNLLLLDNNKQVSINPGMAQKFMIGQLFASMSLPAGIPERYKIADSQKISLQEYALKCQAFNVNCRANVERMLDALYTKYKDADGKTIFQIQKMDMRNAEITEINADGLLIKPQISGKAKDFQDVAEKNHFRPISGEKEIGRIYTDVAPDIQAGTLSLKKALEAYDRIREIRKAVLIPQYVDSNCVIFAAYILAQPGLNKARRSEICRTWIDGISIALDSDNGFVLKTELSPVLFSQTRQELETDVMSDLILLCYRLLMYDGSNEIISQISDSLKEYLLNDQKLAQNLFDMGKESIPDVDLRGGCHLVSCGLPLSNPDFCSFVRNLTQRVVESMGDRKTEADIGIDSIIDLEEYYGRKIRTISETNLCLQILFDDVDVTKVGQQAFRFYKGCFRILLPAFFDGDEKRRDQYKEFIRHLEGKVTSINDDNCRHQFSELLLLSTESFGYLTKDWNEFKVHYSPSEKEFMNALWSKYGQYHFENLLAVIYYMHIDELLPEVIVPLNISLSTLLREDSYSIKAMLANGSEASVINEIISDAFFNHNAEIKQDAELRTSYEEMLDSLANEGYEVAGVLRNEFLIH